MAVTTEKTASYVKFIRGTPTAYAALTNKDSNTLYFISEPNATEGDLYLGNKLISGSGALTLAQLNDVLIQQVHNQDVLTYNGTKWVPMSVASLINEMTGATSTTAGTAGLVPPPSAGDQNKFLRGDGQWVNISGINFNPNVFADSSDGKTLRGYTTASSGQLLQKGSDGIVTWVTPSDLTASLEQAVSTLQATVDSFNGGVRRTIVNSIDLIDTTAPDAETYIYMVPNNNSASGNLYNEYMVINGAVEQIGANLSGTITGYVSTDDFNTAIGGINSRLNNGEFVTTIKYNAEVGDLQSLLHPQTNSAVTLVQQVNELTEHLVWWEFNENNS